MKHVSQGFGVHQAVLDGHVEQGAQRKSIGPWWNRIRQRLLKFFIQNHANFLDVIMYLGKGRPIRRLIGRKATAHRIDAKSKQAVELRMKTLKPEHSLGE